MKPRSAMAAAGVAALVLAAAALSPRVVPFNMDEFVHYHALGCATAPLQQGVPAYRDGCSLYDLRLPFTTTPLPLRSYFYIGSVPVVPFYPFWKLVDGPVAVRLQGATFFLAWLLLAARLLHAGGGTVLAAALVFPAFPVTFLVDEGPVGLAALLFTGALLCLRRALAARGPRGIAWAIAAGLALFAGIWAKLVFACLLPAVAAFAWSELRDEAGAAGRATDRQRAPAGRRSVLAALAAAFLLPTLVLLASTDVDGRPYAAAVRRGRLSLAPADVAARFAELVRVAVDPEDEAPRNILLHRTPLDALPALAALALLAAVALRRGPAARDPRPGRSPRREALAWAGLGLATLAGLSLSAYCQWPHHAFYGLLLFAFALARALEALGPRALAATAAVAALTWGGLAVRASSAAYPVDAAPEKDALLRFVRASGLDRGTLQVHTSWGTYYIAQLFGDPQRTVVFLRALSEDPVQLAEVRDLATRRGRPLLMIGARRWDRFQTPAVTALIGEPSRRWVFGEWWAAEYPTSPSRGASATSASPRP